MSHSAIRASSPSPTLKKLLSTELKHCASDVLGYLHRYEADKTAQASDIAESIVKPKGPFSEFEEDFTIMFGYEQELLSSLLLLDLDHTAPLVLDLYFLVIRILPCLRQTTEQKNILEIQQTLKYLLSFNTLFPTALVTSPAMIFKSNSSSRGSKSSFLRCMKDQLLMNLRSWKGFQVCKG